MADWECVRGTSYIYPDTPHHERRRPPRTRRRASRSRCTSTPNCADWTPSVARGLLRGSARHVRRRRTRASPTPRRTARTASRGATGRRSRRSSWTHGIRLDTNYYYWPDAWVQNRPGFFTGSGMPMRFADLDGSLIDVYQATTQMTDESGHHLPDSHQHAARQRARGRRATTASSPPTCTPTTRTIPGQQTIVTPAIARGVPVVSARQMLTWLDGRNGSSFGNLVVGRQYADLHDRRGRGRQRPAGDGPDRRRRSATSPGSPAPETRLPTPPRRSRASNTRSSRARLDRTPPPTRRTPRHPRSAASPRCPMRAVTRP